MTTKQFLLPIASEITVDLFAGGGGASTGLEQALGRHVDIAVNHDPEAIALHTINHPQTEHYVSDVFEINPHVATRGRPVGLLWASPDCFPAGTMILTDRGYRAIETVVEGDRVLTHAGRYRRVYATMRTEKVVRQIGIQGVPTITVSDEHPFYARSMHNVWDNTNRRYQRTLAPAAWVLAKDLRAGAAPMNAAGGDRHFCATPCSFERIPIPEVGGRGIALDERLMWLAGRYVGDGWSRLGDGRAEVVITCGKTEADDLAQRLALWPRSGERAASSELAWHRRDTKTAHQFSTNHRGLVEWLRDQFGHGSAEKSFPAWALSAPDQLRRALLAGYISADGSEFSTGANQVTETVTISKALAESLGFTATISQPRKNTTVIDGRTVRAKPTYMVRWRETPARSQTVRSDLHNWSRVQAVSAPEGMVEVFNISVEEDETYIADGIVVHNCKHFSKAKGGKPVSKRIRGLAWIVVKWAKAVRPRVIILENVEEFQTWGPLTDDGMPCPERKGQTFQLWKEQLRALGYRLEYKELRACDYGAPTIRKRFFMVARCDGLPIVWPQQTHFTKPAKGQQAWRPASDIIDWSIPCPSIFLTKEEGRALGIKRPLADATCRRIAKGVMRYVVESANPFIVTNTTGHPGAGIDEPLRTVTTGGHHALVVPTLIQTGYGERPGQAPRVPGLDKPLGTIVASQKHAVVAAFLAKHYTGVVGSDLQDPIGTVTSVDHHSLITANLIHMGHGEGKAGGKRFSHGIRDVEQPLNTVTASGCPAGLVTSHLVKLRNNQFGQSHDEPMPTLTAGGGHVGEVRAFLLKYYGTDQDPQMGEPLHTVTTKDRFGLVTVHGIDYQIVDIGLRMLSPRELYRAQGFPDSYIIDRKPDGSPLTKTAQVRMCGNSVSPPTAHALVQANYSDQQISPREKVA